MPEEFDPAWEYWQPDREIEEAIGGELLLDFYENTDDSNRITGISPTNKPDHYRSYIDGGEKAETANVSKMGCKANNVKLIECICGYMWLEGRRKKKKYCSVECRNRAVAQSRIIKFKFYKGVRKPCPECGREVVGRGRGNGKKYCSDRCTRNAVNRRRRKRLREEHNYGRETVGTVGE